MRMLVATATDRAVRALTKATAAVLLPVLGVLRSDGGNERQLHDERAAPAWAVAVSADVSAVLSDEIAGKRQADTETFRSADRLANERIEDPLKHVAPDPDTGVPYRYDGDPVFFAQ